MLLSVFSLSSQVKSEEILIKNDSIKLPGTLTYTKGKSPLVIWVHGSGNVDRNGNQAGTNIKANYIKQFRDSINRKGIAFFSYDKRTADPDNIAFMQNTLFTDFVKDVETVIGHFKGDNRFTEIILLGHSQGSLVAMLAADRADKYISLAGPARRIDEVIMEQTEKNSPMALDTVKAYFMELKTTGTLTYVNPMLQSLFAKRNLPFLASWMQYDPKEEIKKLTVPVLIINGTKDIQVPVTDAEALHRANPNSSLAIIENMNHVLKIIKEDGDNMKSYFSPDFPLSSELIDKICVFVNK